MSILSTNESVANSACESRDGGTPRLIGCEPVADEADDYNLRMTLMKRGWKLRPTR